MKVIYIAGAYRDNRGEFYVRMNIREAERAALIVWTSGGIALCPHKNTAGFGGAYGLSDKVWLEGDLELLKRCDAIWALPSCLSSAGAIEEIKLSESLGIPVLYSQRDLFEFLEKPYMMTMDGDE